MEQTPSLREATILFADLRGFSGIAAAHPPQVVLDLLNRCFAAMTGPVTRHGGKVDKFIGDAAMVVFSAREGAPAEDAARAVRCAVEMQVAMDELNRRHRDTNLPMLYLGIGINSGWVIAGRVGSELYAAHTIIGDEVNLAARIEAFCLRGQILVSERSYELCRDSVQVSAPIDLHVKGREAGLRVREVLGVSSLGVNLPRQERRLSPRIEVRLAFRYQLLASGIVSPQRAGGSVVGLGYHGARAELDRELGLYAELKLELPLPLADYTATDLYGRVVNCAHQGGRHFTGIEFTAMGAETAKRIQLVVQMLMSKPESFWR